MATGNDNMEHKVLPPGIGGPSGGMTVPEGYFEDFTARMADLLPHTEREPAVAPRTLWSKVRPYVYMAAMFAGVWCMLQMFTMMTGMGQLKPIDSNPLIAEALTNDTFFYEYIADDYTALDVVNEILSDPEATGEMTFVLPD